MNECNYCRLCPAKAGTTKARRSTTKGYIFSITLLCILANSSIIKRISCYAKQYASNEAATIDIFSNSINLAARRAYNSHLAEDKMQTSQMYNSQDNANDDDKSNHPIIVYKYDVIDDHNDPADELQLNEDVRAFRDTESYTLLKPKKIYFDFIPNKPLLPSPKPYAEKYNQQQIRKENAKYNEYTGYHDRKKRDIGAFEFRNLQKRTPRLDYLPPACPNCAADRPIQQLINYVKHAVPGKKHNALDIPVPAVVPRIAVMPDMNVSIHSRIAADENERVIFSPGRKPDNRPKANRRPPEVVYREPKPQGFDDSFMNGKVPSGLQANRFEPSPSASVQRTERPSGLLPTNSRPIAQSPPERKVSITQCVWAIVNCCSSSSNEIRYSCFERNGCFGAFWDLNPCAVEVLDSVVTFVGDYYE